MRTSVKEIARVVLVCVIAMLALPAAYRVWLAYHPRPAEPGNRLTQFLERSAEENALRLLKTPPARWTAAERKSEPKVFSWLQAHEKAVLPWEWSDEARRKDPEGCRKLWIALFEEQASELKARLKSERKSLRALERDLAIAETIHAHRTNQLARVRASVATNAFPMVLRVERLTKGRFWGWNTDVELLKLASREDFSATTNGWFQSEHRQVRAERAALADCADRKRLAAGRIAAIPQLSRRLSDCIESASQDRSFSESRALKELLGVINNL